jgi:hypothetical protein
MDAELQSSSAEQSRWVQPSNDKIRAAALALISLVEAHLPQRFYRERRWRVWCATLVVRMADTVEALLALMDADLAVDGATVLRSLYEEVVGFLWIAAEPDQRLGQWADNARFWERKMHTDAEPFGIKLLSPSELSLTKGAKKMPDLAQRSAEVDAYWGPRLIGFRPPTSGQDGILTFRGLYAAIYRFTSRAAHAQPDAMDPYVEPRLYPVIVARPKPTLESIWWPLAVPLYAQALLVCHETLKWPDPVTVRAINDAMYVQSASSLPSRAGASL